VSQTAGRLRCFAASSKVPSAVNGHFIHSHVPPVLTTCWVADWAGGIQIDHMQRAVAVTGVEPPAMRRDAVGAGDIVVHAAGALSLTPTKPPMVRLKVLLFVSMTSMPEFERSLR